MASHTNTTDDSWWVFSKLHTTSGPVHEIYAWAHILHFDAGGQWVVLSSNFIWDRTTDQHIQQEVPYDPSQVQLATDQLSVVTPNNTMIEEVDSIALNITLPTASASLSLKPDEQVIYNASVGSFPFLGGANYQYGIPGIDTTGTVTIDGVERAVEGEAWIDRQYGGGDVLMILSGGVKWTWFSIELDHREDVISAWAYEDLVSGATNFTFATIRRPDGTHIVAPMTMTGTDIYTSPTSNQSYPTRFQLSIPSAATYLTVESIREDQEIQSPMMPRYMAAGEVMGIYRGLPAHGRSFFEMVGNHH